MSKTIESIYGYFEDRADRVGNDTLIPLAHCAEFIELCRKQRTAILGVASFSVNDEQKRVPNLDEISDFSSTCENG